MDSDEKALLTESLDRLVQQTPATGLDAALAEFGWHELLDDEPAAAVAILLELEGQRLARSSSLDTAMLCAAGFDPADTAVVLPPPGSATPTTTTVAHGGWCTLRIDGVAKARETAPVHVVTPVLHANRVVMARVRWSLAWPSTGTGAAPEAGWARVTGELSVGPGELSGDATTWERMRATGHRALAHELIGLGGAMLRLAVEHVASRNQFGKLLGSFQAVKHQLADVRLAQECATLAAEAAWEAQDDREAVVAALVAKASANRFSQTARRNCQQVLGGMGFTWEHPFHHYLKRSLLVEPLLGATEALHAELGAQVRAGTLPRLAML